MGWFGPDRRYIIPVNLRYLTGESKQILLKSLDVLTEQYKQIVNLILEFEKILAKREFQGKKFRTPFTSDRINYEEAYKVTEYMLKEIKQHADKMEAVIKALLPSIAKREMSETRQKLQQLSLQEQQTQPKQNKQPTQEQLLAMQEDLYNQLQKQQKGKKPGFEGLGGLQPGYGRA